MSINVYTPDGQNKIFEFGDFSRKVVAEWLGYPAVKFYTTENGEDELTTILPDTTVFAIPYIPDKSLDADITKACEDGNIDEVMDLISRCADVNAKCRYLSTPLHWASLNGHALVVDILLKNGADVNATNSFTQTPLMFASNNETDLVETMLAENGASYAIGEWH